MNLKERLNSLLIEAAMSPATPAAVLGDQTSGGDRDNTPRGAFQKLDNDRVEEILTRAMEHAEKVLGRVWDGTRHVARKHKTMDERDWQIHVLKTYQGVRHGLAAAEEDVERHVIRDLRKRCCLDNLGRRLPDQQPESKWAKIVEEAGIE
jgi:hypothetical protein